MKAVAPGKLIISGDHSVVYGQPALVMAINRYAEAEVRAATDNHITLASPVLGPVDAVAPAELRRRRDEATTRHEQFLNGRREIGDVVDSPGDLLLCAVAAAFDAAGRGDFPPVHVALSSSIPLGCGMGSSAALSLAVVRAVMAHVDHSPTDDELYEAALSVERLQHGRPSGTDVYTCLHGGFLRSGPDGCVALDIPTPIVFVADTGRPSASTGECVSAVHARLADSAIWDDFGAVTRALEAAVRRTDNAETRKQVRENHRLLREIGVVPDRVAAFIDDIERAGGAAKTSGAGAVTGDAAGTVLIFADREPTELCRTYGFDLMSVHGEPHGVHLD